MFYKTAQVLWCCFSIFVVVLGFPCLYICFISWSFWCSSKPFRPLFLLPCFPFLDAFTAHMHAVSTRTSHIKVCSKSLAFLWFWTLTLHHGESIPLPSRIQKRPSLHTSECPRLFLAHSNMTTQRHRKKQQDYQHCLPVFVAFFPPFGAPFALFLI